MIEKRRSPGHRKQSAETTGKPGRVRYLACFWALFATAGCGGGASDQPDGGQIADGTVSSDSAELDGATPDHLLDSAQLDAFLDAISADRSDAILDSGLDGNGLDGGNPNDILGTFNGSCGSVLSHLASTSPSVVNNAITYVSSEMYVRTAFSPGGQRLYDTPNAGGSSGESEVVSFEVLHHCDGATLLKTETEVLYAPPSDAGANSITDYLAAFGSTKIGVSVTRAYKPTMAGMTDMEIKELLERKLTGIIASSARVLAADRWQKQILHVFVTTPSAEAAVARVLPTISAQTRADTIVVVTKTTGGGFIYCNPDPPLGTECALN